MIDLPVRILRLLPPETAHRATVELAARFAPFVPRAPKDDPRLAVEALGLRWEILTAAVDRSQPDIFRHVWPRVILPTGRESLDASHGAYPGWQVPSEDIHRLWVFNSDGQRVSEQGRFNGLHAYRARRGMGATVCDDSGCYDDLTGEVVAGGTPYTATGTSYSDLCAAAPDFCKPVTLTGSAGATQTVAGYTAPSQSSAQWATFASQMLKSGLTLD